MPKYGSKNDIDIKEGSSAHIETFGMNVEISSSNEIQSITFSDHFVSSSQEAF